MCTETVKIAVFTDGNRSPADFYSAKAIDIYEKRESWFPERTEILSPVSAETVAQIREEATRRRKLIDDCSIIAAKEISGIPFAVFDMARYGIFTVSRISEEILDGMAEDVSEAVQESRGNQDAVRPYEVSGSGSYELDLIALQTRHPEITSKMALADFLENTPFLDLRLRCTHLPPWILKKEELRLQKTADDEYVIMKKQCRQC